MPCDQGRSLRQWVQGSRSGSRRYSTTLAGYGARQPARAWRSGLRRRCGRPEVTRRPAGSAEVEMAELYVKPGERGSGLGSPGPLLPRPEVVTAWGADPSAPRAHFTLVLPSAGNKERGWNDPPQFSYGLQTQAGGPKRSPLTKRVAAPQDGSPRGAWGPWAQRPPENRQCQG